MGQASKDTLQTESRPHGPRAGAPELPEVPALTPADGVWARLGDVSQLIYWGIHVGSLAVLWTGVDPRAFVLFLVTYFGRMFAITAGYHRYFAHRTFRTGRGFQFLLALLGCSAVQKGPLWWAGIHRRHHRYADGPGDAHSPRDGIWYAHQGWVFDPRWNATPVELIRDFERYPELVWLNRWHFVPVAGLAALCWAIGGASGFVWGFLVSTTLLWHCTYAINSLAHLVGRRRYDTPDTSRNNWVLALLTLGEGWHNNHHHYMASTRQGFRWWEVDVSYYLLRGLAALGLVWDLREPPRSVIEGRGRPAGESRRAGLERRAA